MQNYIDKTTPKKTFVAVSPYRHLFILTLTIFVLELAIMIGIEFNISQDPEVYYHTLESILDTVLLTLLVFPILFYYSYRPLMQSLAEHSRLESALSASNLLLEKTIASLRDAVLVVSLPDLDVITCNPTVSSIIGYECEELIGQNLFEIFQDQEPILQFLEKIIHSPRNGRDLQQELKMRHKDGRQLAIDITASMIKDEKSLVQSEVIVINDITRRIQDMEQLARHNKELVTLGHLGQAVTSTLELDAVFDQVVSQVMPLLHAECFTILLREEDELVNYAVGGIGEDSLRGQRIPIDGFSKEVIQSGESKLISCEAEICIFANLEAVQVCGYTPQALMLIPLKQGDDVIGLIQAVNTSPNSFDQNDVRMLEAAASWAVIAISHARQHQEIQHRLKETATLAAINQSLNETLDMDRILQLIADSTLKLINNVDRVVIHMLDEREYILEPAYWSGLPDSETPALFMNLDEGIAGQALTEGRLINVADVEENPHFKPYSAARTFKSLMVAPLQSGRRPLGTISVHNSIKKTAFSSGDEQKLMRLADSAAVTISTANLYQAERNQRQLAEALASAAALLNLSLKLDEVINTVLEQTLRLVPCEKATIFLIKEEEVYLSRSTDKTEVPNRLPDALYRIFIEQDVGNVPHPQLMAETGKPIMITEVAEKITGMNGDDTEWLKPLVVAPLRTRQDIIGFLNVHSNRSGAFDNETIRRLEALAAHASLAIQNATLYMELKASLQKETSTRAQLVQAQKLTALGRMVASVAHELNNPLQTIKNCLFLIQQDFHGESDFSNYLDMALSETGRLSNLVVQLKEVYRPGERGPKTPVSLGEILEGVRLILAPHLKQNKVKWYHSKWPEAIVVEASANQLKQVLLNICLNGIEAMQPNGGTLSIYLIQNFELGEIGVAIQDSGQGIPPESMTHLFEPFYTTKETGTGLGLAICYDIIQTHGGRIEVDSAIGRGTTFTIWLPQNHPEIEGIEEKT